MIIISEQEFINKKKSNTLVILGSGSSIKDISDAQWGKINQFDSIGFNWFCHHKFCPTFYLIREQGSTISRSNGTETLEDLYKDLSKDEYKNTCVILSDIKHHSPNCFRIDRKRIRQEGIICRDVKGKICRKLFTQNIFARGIFHGRCTITNVIHVGLYLKYERIVFVGVDLYNSRYFWLPNKKTRSQIHRLGLSHKSVHPITYRVTGVVAMVSKFFKFSKLYSANPKSLLNKHIPYISLHEL